MANETDTLRPITTLGFIGLGVMGEPMCGHLARRVRPPGAGARPRAGAAGPARRPMA